MEDFKEAAIARGLNETSLQILLEQDITNTTVLGFLKQDTDLKQMDLAPDQHDIVRKWIQELQTPPAMDEQEKLNYLKQKFADLDEIQQMVDQVAVHVRKMGVKGIDDLFQSLLAQSRDKPYNIGVVGQAGVGKSSLINAICGYSMDDPRAAEVSISKSTDKLHPYQPSPNSLVFWDVPPLGRSLEHADLWKYNALIIVSTGRFSEVDFAIAGEAHKFGQPFVYVRTKIDQDVRNSKADMGPSYNESRMLERIKENALENLAPLNLPDRLVFLVSSVRSHRHQWGLPTLETEIGQFSRQRNNSALKYKLCSTARDHLEDIARHFENTIDNHAESVAEQTNENVQTDMLNNIIRKTVTTFGLTNSDVDENQMQCEANRVIQSLTTLRGDPNYTPRSLSYRRCSYMGVMFTVVGIFWLYHLSAKDQWSRWVWATVPLVLSLPVGYLCDRYMVRCILETERQTAVYQATRKSKKDEVLSFLVECLKKALSGAIWVVDKNKI